MRKILLLIFCLPVMLCVGGCSADKAQSPQKQSVYKNITAEEAKDIIDTESGYLILDVRTQEEFEQGHIPNAVNLDYQEIAQKAEEVLPDKNQKILIYCRSGRRSKIAAQELLDMGYTSLYEFGGIIDWPYDTVTE
ncbi:MAG: rhodanese-like domain-containing protein [Ruminococcus sp.]|nr:rhodanese-like domain-containing protein [Ruminococcus sp.]